MSAGTWTAHGDQLVAFNALINQAINSGYGTIDPDLGEKGLVASILANLMTNVVSDSLQATTTNGALTLQGNGTNGVVLGAGTPITRLSIYLQTLTPTPTTAAVACVQEQLFTTGALSNLATGDVIIGINKPTQTGTLMGVAQGRVAGAGTLGISFVLGIGSVTPGAEVYAISVLRHTTLVAT
ncbi:MAG: hypothetical protein ACR652_24395 [Methylocystis sp.]|uniref:hypothetical protein n=1 Tax=Methylocystis sp. TaxID=1911079 RepID=UPI003DA2496F